MSTVQSKVDKNYETFMQGNFGDSSSPFMKKDASKRNTELGAYISKTRINTPKAKKPLNKTFGGRKMTQAN